MKPNGLKNLHSELGIPADYVAVRGLPLQAEATRLVEADFDPHGNVILLSPATSKAWKAMKHAAAAAGISLLLEYGSRSIEQQTQLIRAELQSGSTLEMALKRIAAPGYSEHHTGRAIDIGCPGCSPVTAAFASTDAFAWLTTNAGAFGFVLSYPSDNPYGIIYEPWHWCCQTDA